MIGFLRVNVLDFYNVTCRGNEQQALGRFAAARTISGRLVFNVPLDHLVWTETMAGFVDGANYHVKALPGVTEKHLWVTGTVSSLARRELNKRGFQVHERSDASLMGGLKSYPKYEKTAKAPSGTLEVKATSIALGVGVSWGDGKLRFRGKEYAFSVEYSGSALPYC